MCSENGGNAEVVEEGVTGFIVGVGDAEGLARRLRAIRDDAALRAEMGRRARAAIHDKFSISRLLADTEAVYEELVAVKRGAQ